MNKLVGLCALLYLLAGCRGGDIGSENASDAPTSIVPNLPSIEELAGTPAPELPSLPPLDPDEIALGSVVYAEHCAECHGENLEGEPDWKRQNDDGSFRAPPHDASGHTWHHSDRVLVESIELGGGRLPDNIGGTSNMPAFSDVLTDGEIAAVLCYIKSTWPEETRMIQWEQTVREGAR